MDNEPAAWRMPRHLDAEFRVAIFSVDEFVLVAALLWGGIMLEVAMWTLPILIIGIPLLRKFKSRWGSSFSWIASMYWFTPLHIRGLPQSWKQFFRG